MRLVNIDAVIEEHCSGCSPDIREGCKTDPVCASLMWLTGAPVVDAVEVVRCVDCDKSEPSNVWDGWVFCRANRVHQKGDNYCSYGKKKEASDDQRT